MTQRCISYRRKSQKCALSRECRGVSCSNRQTANYSLVQTKQEDVMQIDPAKLVDARLARAMSQEEAAIAADLSARTIQRIEAGLPASLESTKALLTIFGAHIIQEIAALPMAVQRDSMRLIIERSCRQSVGLAFDGVALLFAATALIVALGKFFVPSQTGLFMSSTNEFEGVGIINPAKFGHEVLGFWIVPLMLLMSSLLLMSADWSRRIVLNVLFGRTDRG